MKLYIFRTVRLPIIRSLFTVKVKVILRQAEVAQWVPGRLRPRIFLTFGTTRVVVRQPYGTVAFTPGEIPGIHFQGRRKPRKKSPVPPTGIDPGTPRLVAQCLNHYATPGPSLFTVHSAMVYVIHVCRQLSSRSICSCSKAVYKPV